MLLFFAEWCFCGGGKNLIEIGKQTSHLIAFLSLLLNRNKALNKDSGGSRRKRRTYSPRRAWRGRWDQVSDQRYDYSFFIIIKARGWWFFFSSFPLPLTLICCWLFRSTSDFEEDAPFKAVLCYDSTFEYEHTSTTDTNNDNNNNNIQTWIWI